MAPLARVLTLLTLLCASLGTAQAARITVCEDANFRGRCVTLDRAVETLDGLGMNDRISSFRTDAEPWEVCTDARFQGECAVLSGAQRDLAGSGFQDRISSLRPARESGGHDRDNSDNRQPASIVVYQDSDFRGRSRVITGDVPDLAKLGFNDKISSVRVQSGHWRLCRDADYQDCVSVDQGGIRDLSALGLNDAVSSIQSLDRRDGWRDRDDHRAERDDNDWRGGAVAILYEDAGFRGRHQEVRGSVRDLERIGFNDRVSSIRISGGRWQICRDSNFQGRCIEIDHSVTDLADHDFNDAASSIRQLP